MNDDYFKCMVLMILIYMGKLPWGLLIFCIVLSMGLAYGPSLLSKK